MRKQLMKILFSVMLMFSLVFCLKTTANATEEVDASVSGITLTQNYGSIDIEWTDSAYYTAVYVNDVFCNYVYYYNQEGSTSTAYYYLWTDYVPGTYTIKLVPYDLNGNEGTAKTKSITVAMDIGNIEYDAWTSYVLKASGYVNPAIKMYFYVDNTYMMSHFEVQKYDSSSKSYKAHGTAYNWSDYIDEDVTVDKSYTYRVRAVSNTNTYITEPQKSDWVKLAKQSVTIGDVYSYVSLNEDGKPYIYVDCYYGDYVSGYKIYRATSKNGKYSLLKTVTGSEYYVDNSAKDNKTYYYKIRPYYYKTTTGKYYYGDYTSPQAVKTYNMDVYNFTAKETSSTSVKLSWDKVSGAEGYEIYYKENISGQPYRFLTTISKTSCTKTNLNTDSSYTFMIRSYKTVSGVKYYSDCSYVYTNTGLHAPNVEQSSRTVSYSSGTLTVKTKLTWDKVYGAAKYIIYKEVDGTRTKVKEISSSGTRSYTVTQKVSKTEPTGYDEYIVVAYKSSSKKEETSEWVYPYLKHTSSVSVSRKTATSVNVSWKAVTGAERYDVYRYLNGYSTYVGSTSNLKLVDKGLTPGVKYKYVVRAYNDTLDVHDEYYYEYEDGTNVKEYTLKVIAPTIKSGTNSASKKATIKWSGTSIAKEYKIYRATSKSGTYELVATVDADKTSYTDTKLTVGKTYYYKVVASTVNDGGVTVNSVKSAYKAVKITK